MRRFVPLVLVTIGCCQALQPSAQQSTATDRRSFVRNATIWTVAGTTTSSLSLPGWLGGTGGPEASSSSVAWAAPPTMDPPLPERLDKPILKQPPTLTAAGNLGSAGIDNTRFPDFLAGTWSVTQTLIDATTPLGLVYVGGPNGVQSIAESTMAETRSKLNQPVSLQLRFVPTKFGVLEDRLFNNAQRLDAFAGRKVVATVDYADVGASNRAAILNNGGTAEDPLETVLIRYKGPAAQKTFVTSHATTAQEGTDENGNNNNKWYVSEGQRSIFQLTNANTAPPIFTDSEVLYEFIPTGPDRVQAKLRLVGYLNAQSDKLYFDARNRAVSILDYTLDMKRLST